MKNWKPLALLNDLILMALGVALTAVAAGYQESLIWLSFLLPFFQLYSLFQIVSP